MLVRRTSRLLIALISLVLLLISGCADSESPAASSSGGAGDGPGPATTASATTSATTAATTAATRTAAADPPSATAGSSASESSAPVSWPVTVPADNGPITIAAKPTHIVSLSPTATETLFAIGAGPQVVAVDSYSDYPPEAPHTKISAFDPDVETIMAEHPDLVILAYDAQGITAKLEEGGVTVLEADAVSTIDAAYAQIELLGDATGNGAKARAVVRSMRAKLKQIVASTATPTKPLTYYHELDSQFHTLTSATFAGQVYSLFGLKNIADQAKGGGDYPQLSAEYIISAAPDLIFLADEGGSAEAKVDVAKRPGWGAIPAVRDGRVVALNPDVASRWGPRIVDFAEAVSKAINAAS